MRAVEYVLSFASFVLWPSIQLLLLQHLLSFLYPGVPSFLHSFFHPPAPDLCHMQIEGASGVEVLLAIRAGARPHPFEVASETSGLPNPLEYEQCHFAIWIRIKALH